MDYKGQEPSNLVFSEFRRSLLYSKTFLYFRPAFKRAEILGCGMLLLQFKSNPSLSSKKVWVDKIFAVVMKKRSIDNAVLP